MAERQAQAPRAGRLSAAVILLALGSGAVDAFSFAGLGAVFASVMTGNLVLLGVAVVHARLDPALSAASAIVAYVAGVFGATIWFRRTGAGHLAAARRDIPGRSGVGGEIRRAARWAPRNDGTDRNVEAGGGAGGSQDGRRRRGRRVGRWIRRPKRIRREIAPGTRTDRPARTRRASPPRTHPSRTRRGLPRRTRARRPADTRRGLPRRTHPARTPRGLPRRTPPGWATRARRRNHRRRPAPVRRGRGGGAPGGPAWRIRAGWRTRKGLWSRTAPRGNENNGEQWPDHVRRALTLVPFVQALTLAGWLGSGGHPDETAQILLLALSAFAMGVQSAGVNTLPLAGAATTYLTGTLTALTTELATSGVPSTMRRRFAVLAAALAGAGLDAALLVWARPAAPALPLAATLAVVILIGRRR